MPIKGNLVIRANGSGQPFYEAKWRDTDRRQAKRRLGPAFLDADGNGWKQPKGKAPDGLLTRDDALVAMRDAIAAWQGQQAIAQARASVSDQPQTFAEAAQRWLCRAERRGRKVSTLTDYSYTIGVYLAATSKGSRRLGIGPAPFATMRLAELRGTEAATIVGAWFDSMPNGSRTKEKLGMIVNSVFKLAVAQGWTTINPMDRVDREPVKYDPSSYDWYSTIEVERLIAAAGKQRDGLIYAISAFAGLRCGEALAIKWADIDFETRRIKVIDNVSYGQRTTTKGGRGRTVPLINRLATMLLAYKAATISPGKAARSAGEAATISLDGSGTPSGLVFPGNFGAEYLDPSTLRRRYAKDVKRADLRHLPMHSLRHHFGSVAVNSASLVQVRDWLGHADMRTTSRYLHSKSHASDADTLGAGFEAA